MASSSAGPVLTGLSIAPVVDLTQGDASERYTATASDPTSSITTITVQLDRYYETVTTDGVDFINASDTITFPNNYNHYESKAPPPVLVDGDTYTSLNLIHDGTPAGVYNITEVTLADAAGNVSVYSSSQLQSMGLSTSFTVVDDVPADTTAPVLNSLSLPTSISGPASAPYPSGNVSINVTDVGTGFDHAVLQFDGGLGSVVVGNFQSPIDTGNNYSNEVVFAPGLQTGTYHLTSATVYDLAGNSTVYSASQLAAAGDNTSIQFTNPDTTPPVLSGLTLPTIVYAGGDAAPFSVTGSDVGYGLESLTLVLDHTFQTASGATDEVTLAFGDSGVSGYTTYGTDLVTLDGAESFAVGSPGGVYTVTKAILTDEAGNSTEYTTAQLQAHQLATSFEVAAGYTASPGHEVLTAPATGYAFFQGDGGGSSEVVLNGNVGDYTLSRFQPADVYGTDSGQVGAFLLTATNGSGAYAISETISTVQFQDGQYLALHDLPAYIHGSAVLNSGSSNNDLLYQNTSEAYQLVIGGSGDDTLYLNGDVGDYTLRSFTAVTPFGMGAAGHYDPGQTYSGLELVASNGSGAILIDPTVETIQFKDGQYLAYGDLHSYVAANAQASATLDISPEGDTDSSLTFYGPVNGGDTVLLNGNVGDYSLSRDSYGDFVLDTHTGSNGVENTLSIPQSVVAVQFADGQYLAPQDLGAYLSGSDVFTSGYPGSPSGYLLFTPLSGDSYVNGGDGTDNLYLTGNTRDYTIQAVNVAATSNHLAINGYELVADNGSGNIYIDSSVETIHFQDGQYLAFHDLTAYIDPFHG